MKKLLLLSLLLFNSGLAVASYSNPARHMVEFLTSGQWTAPPGVGEVQIEGCGGGGGGAWGQNPTAAQGGGGGGSAAWWVGVSTTVIPGVTYNINIGAGGVGGSSSPVAGRPGTAGSTTTFNGLELLPGRNTAGVLAGGDGGGGYSSLLFIGGEGGALGFAGADGGIRTVAMSGGLKSTQTFTSQNGSFYGGAGGGAAGNASTAYKGGDFYTPFMMYSGGLPSLNRSGGGAAGAYGPGTDGKTTATADDAANNSCAGGGGVSTAIGAGTMYKAGNGGSGRLRIYYIGP